MMTRPYYPQFSSLPSWVRMAIPSFFYITEKAWNYYPFTVTGMFGIAMQRDGLMIIIYLFSNTILHLIHRIHGALLLSAFLWP